MPTDTTLIGLTATLLAGRYEQELFTLLGLPPGSFFFQRRSNIRGEVQNLFRELRHGLGGWTFPDLAWIMHSSRKTIIFCDTISLSFRLRVYFRTIAPNKAEAR